MQLCTTQPAEDPERREDLQSVTTAKRRMQVEDVLDPPSWLTSTWWRGKCAHMRKDYNQDDC